MLPDEDNEKSLAIIERRSTGDTRDNRKFIESSCNTKLATMTIYGNNRQPSEIAEEIISNIKQRQRQQSER